FTAAADFRSRRFIIAVGRAQGSCRKENVEHRSRADFAFNFDPAFMLVDDAVNRREAEASPLPYFFCRKKRFEDVGNSFRRHPATGVTNAQADKFPRPRTRLGFFQSHSVRADEKFSATWHGIAR